MSNVTELEVVTEEAPQQSADEPPHRARPTCVPSRDAPRSGPTCPTRSGMTGAGSSATG